MWNLAGFVAAVLFIGGVVCGIIEFCKWNCRKADEKYKKWEAEYGR